MPMAYGQVNMHWFPPALFNLAISCVVCYYQPLEIYQYRVDISEREVIWSTNCDYSKVKNVFKTMVLHIFYFYFELCCSMLKLFLFEINLDQSVQGGWIYMNKRSQEAGCTQDINILDKKTSCPDQLHQVYLVFDSCFCLISK